MKKLYSQTFNVDYIFHSKYTLQIFITPFYVVIDIQIDKSFDMIYLKMF